MNGNPLSQGYNYQVITGAIQGLPVLETVTVPAGKSVTLALPFSMLYFFTMPTPADITLTLGNSGQKTALIGAGVGYKFPGILQSFTLTNSGVSDQNIQYSAGIGDVIDNRFVISGTIESDVVSALSCTDSADVTAVATSVTALLASNTNRKTAIFTNSDTSNAVRIGGAATVGATKGTWVYAGQQIFLDTRGALSVYNPNSTSVVITVSELTN